MVGGFRTGVDDDCSPEEDDDNREGVDLGGKECELNKVEGVEEAKVVMGVCWWAGGGVTIDARLDSVSEALVEP